MVVKSDGTKWACMSCLKGHRVSGCTHTDRELVLVPKKGRPVTQCHHCRQERKKRSAHVKCDCGEVEKPHHPREKCIHLREAEERAKAGFRDSPPSDKDAAHLVAVAEEQGCCCHHGGKCSCSILKKESKDNDGLPHGPAVKPRLETTRSEGSITVFQNGHHKPVHRKNHAAHECGMPYKMPLPRSNTDCSVPKLPRRSVDSLASDASIAFNSSTFAQQMAYDQDNAHSEQPSPMSSNMFGQDGMSNVDFAAIPRPAVPERSNSASSEIYAFPAFDPLGLGADASFDPWSMSSNEATFMPNNNPFGVWPTNPDAANLAQPALTAASSGTQSEIDEIPNVDDMFSFGMPSIQEDAINLYSGVGGPGSPQANRRSLPPNFFSQSDFVLPIGEVPNSTYMTSGDDAKSNKGFDASPSMVFTDPWNALSAPQRNANGLPTVTGRAPSHSVGPGSAPSDEFMQQLFPEMDLSSNIFSAGSPPNFTLGKPYHTNTSVPVEYGGLENESSLTTQGWTDGSLDMIDDNFTASYGLDRDLTRPEFNNAWPQ